MKHNILSHQINDDGQKKLRYSYKNIYDTYLILKHIKIDKNLIEDKTFLNYFIVTENLGIKLIETKKSNYHKLTSSRFRLKNKSRFYFILDELVLYMIKKIKFLPKQIFEFCSNRNYRKYYLKKLFN